MHEEKRGISRAEEEARMEKCEALIKSITGRKPVGHRGPGSIFHPFTMEMLAERGYLYSSNMKDTDSDYFHEIGNKKLLELPTHRPHKPHPVIRGIILESLGQIFKLFS